MYDSMRTLTLSPKHLFQLVRLPPLSYKMRTGVPIILFVAVAGFHNVISVSLESDEGNESSEEREYAVENSTTPQTDESQYAAAHVNDDLIKTTRKDGETEAVSNDTDEYAAAHMTDGETEAGSEDTEERNNEDSKESMVLEKEDDDGETGTLTDITGANTGSDKSVEADSEKDEADYDESRYYYY